MTRSDGGSFDAATGHKVMVNSRGFAVGVQWHPEYWVKTDSNSARIFKAFGDAVRAHALAKTGMKLDDIDLIEINEAFVPVVQAWMKELGADPKRVNVNGGAVALGHPIGATGARLMTTLLHELERTNGRWGLQTMCEGGGQANVTIIERL